MCSFPGARRVFVGLDPGRVDMDGSQDLVQTEAVTHRENEFDDQIARVSTDYGAPRIVSLPGTVSTLTRPSADSSAMARSRSSMP